MSSQRPSIPADMLLLNERRRRLRQTTAEVPQSEDILAEQDEQLDDQLIDAEAERVATAGSEKSAVDGLRCFRPVEHVSLALLQVGDAINHDELQSNITCAPVEAASVGKSASSAALAVSLTRGDLEVLEAVSKRSSSLAEEKTVTGLVRAAFLADDMVNVGHNAAAAAAPLLSAYRRASLQYAWQWFFTQAESDELRVERDEAAVALLSVLRALLGEY